MRLYAFGTYQFELASVRDELGNAQARNNFVMTPAGAYDANGADEVLDGPQTIRRDVTLYATTPAALQTKIDAARALRGTKAKLYATAYDDTTRWIEARCAEVNITRTNRNFNQQPVTFRFETQDGLWRNSANEAWTLDDTPQIYLDTGYYLDSGAFTETMSSGSPHTITVTNDGNKPVRDCVITVTAGTNAIADLNIANDTTGICEIDYDVTLTAGDALVLDCGAFSAVDDGADAYADISLGSTHATPYWMVLEPGDNDIILTFTGGHTDSTVSVAFADGWA